jgi:hypothetical protein
MSDATTSGSDGPIQLAGNWVLASLDDVGQHVRMHVSISLGSGEAVQGGELGVTVTANGQTLNTLEAPDASSVLPTVETRGSTAFAQYTFDNPDQTTQLVATVTLRGESASFDISGGPLLIA